MHCDGGWRPWTFVRIETDDGLVGWGECSDNRSPYGIAGCVRDMAHLLVGQDPRPVERLYWDMLRATRQNLGGVTHKAIAGIELALWDIKAKALGVPVYELFGGPLRDRVRAVLVALRHHARAHVADARHAAAARPTPTSLRWARRSWRAALPRSRPTS